MSFTYLLKTPDKSRLERPCLSGRGILPAILGNGSWINTTVICLRYCPIPVLSSSDLTLFIQTGKCFCKVISLPSNKSKQIPINFSSVRRKKILTALYWESCRNQRNIWSKCCIRTCGRSWGAIFTWLLFFNVPIGQNGLHHPRPV
jgi:hypothetical protein